MTLVDDVMTTVVCALPESCSLVDAAREMRDRDIGDVLVVDDDGALCEIVTDRDLAVRGVASGVDPALTPLRDVCSTMPLVTQHAGDSLEDAIACIRTNAVRRIPVVEAGAPVGIITLGDLAMQRDPSSVLADISAEPPNN